MSNVTREDTKKGTSAMNHMRNIVYHLIKWMKSKGINETKINNRLHRMGKNVAETELTLFKFKNSELESLIEEIYSKIMNSKIEIKIDQETKEITVIDNDCSLCKYPRDDINNAPCEIITSMVSEILLKSGFNIKENWVQQSKSLGANKCVHKYDFGGLN